jgi:hypothetical protein
MPNQPLLWVALHHALDDLVGGEVLLVATEDLDAAVFAMARLRCLRIFMAIDGI